MGKLSTLKELSSSKKIILYVGAGAIGIFILVRSFLETYDNEVKKLKDKQNVNVEKKVDINDRAIFDIDQTTAIKNKIEEVKKEFEEKLSQTSNKNEELNKQIEENQKILQEQQNELITLKTLNQKEERVADRKIIQEVDQVKNELESTKEELERLKREKDLEKKLDSNIKLPELKGPLAEVMPVEKKEPQNTQPKMPVVAKVQEKGFFKLNKEAGQSENGKTPTVESGKELADGENQENEKKFESRKMDLMMGLVDAIMVTGVDAPTNIGTKNSDAKDPLPVLLSVNSETIIANSHVQEYKDCFILGTATGNATTERAYVRLSKLSCVAKNGDTRIETDIEGWVYGEDNKVGVSGHLVTKSGSLILKGLMAGILQGIADSTSNTDNYFDNGNGYSNRNNNNFGRDAADGVGSGVGSAFKTLADFYIDMAKDLYPVIEVKGGREVQILVKGGKQITEAPYNKLFVNTDYEITLNKNISIEY